MLFFGKHAGLAGMIDSLWALGRRLDWEKIENPFSKIKLAHQYEDLKEAKEHISEAGNEIRKSSLPDMLVPFVCGFAGYGNVSQGAQEIFDLLPCQKTYSRIGNYRPSSTVHSIVKIDLDFLGLSVL